MLERDISTGTLMKPLHPFVTAEPGQFINEYEVVRVLGEGGMGIVYLVRSPTDPERLLALKTPKVLRLSLSSETRRQARFAQETTLAHRLRHPGIARFIDAGTHEGLPYFVMEYVDGEAITTYCTQRRLSIRERVSLFVQACDAVAHAHQHLIVHRDLKPSNIFVVERDHIAPRTKLLDFGIAKLLDDEGDHPALTTATQAPMTRQYAAPEQVRGDVVSIATDTYALGVVLYELLVGAPPYVLEGASPARAEHLILNAEPGAPSRAARLRGKDAAGYVKALRGDLDAIVLKALQKNPEQRYRSVGALARDLRRYLHGEPVLARPGALRLRAATYVQRHTTSLALTATALLLLVVFSAFHAVRIGVERDRAEREAAAAEAYATILEDIFESPDPNIAQGEVITALDLLSQGTARARGLPAELEARVLRTIGHTYIQLSEYGQADSVLLRALTLHDSIPAVSPADLVRAQLAMTSLRLYQGQYAEADSLLRESFTLLRPANPADGFFLADVYNGMSIVAQARGDFYSADSLLSRAIAAHQRAEDADTRPFDTGEQDYLIMLTNHGIALTGLGDYARADSVYVDALEQAELHFGPQSVQTAALWRERASLSLRRDHYELAERQARSAASIYRAAFGTGHIETAVAEQVLGVALVQRGKLEEARAFFESSLRTSEALVGPSHRYALQNRIELAKVHQRLGQFDTAAHHFTELLAAARSSLGANHPEFAQYLSNYGAFNVVRGRLDLAEDAYEEALAIRQAALPAEHPGIASTLSGLGNTLTLQGKAAAAIPVLTEAVAIYVVTLDASNTRLAKARLRLGRALLLEDRWEEAEPVLRASHEVLAAARGTEHTDTVDAAGLLAELYRRQGRAAEAAHYTSL
ncbi:MAG: serine/threonine-protein kinase [Bacteroidota bacterium]